MPKKQTKNEPIDALSALRKVMNVSADDPLVTRADKYIAITGVISTGSTELDSILTPTFYEENQKGGIPRGFVCEFYGPHGGGKSSLCYKLASDVTRAKEIVTWFDIEGSFYPEWAENFGVDCSKVFHVSSGKTGEEYLDGLKKTAASGNCSLIVVDSVTGIRPRKLMEQELDKEQRVGASAALMSRVLPDIVSAARKGNTTVVFVNQVRKGFAHWGTFETTPHGEALKFYSSLRLRVGLLSAKKGKRNIMSKGEEIGIRSHISIQKSRFGPPFRECIMPIYFGGMVPDPLEVLLDLAMLSKVIKCKTKKGEGDEDDSQTFTYQKEQYEDIDDLKHTLITEEDDLAELVNLVAEKQGKEKLPSEYQALVKTDGDSPEVQEETKQAEI